MTNPANDSGKPIADLLERGFNSEIGFTITEWSDGDSELQLELRPQLLNRSDILHGGVTVTLLDVACGLAGCYCNVEGNVRRAVTLSLNTQFMATTNKGLLTARARRRSGGFKIFFADAELLDEDGNLLATAQGTYRYTKGSETLEGKPLD